MIKYIWSIQSAKRFASLLIFLWFLPMLLVSCKENPSIYEPGTYTGEAEGYYSRLVVDVTVDEAHILDIEIVSSQEPEILAKIVFEKLPPKIIKKNSADVDVISGATYTSQALINAVKKALNQAQAAREDE